MDKQQLDLAYDVEHLASGKIIGYRWGKSSNELSFVYNSDGNIVGNIVPGVARGEFVLDASKAWHTGKSMQGDQILWSNVPSRKFNK